MAKEIIPIVFSTDEKYAPFADVCIESIHTNSSQDCDYEITVLHTGLKQTTINKLSSKEYDNVNVKCLDVSDMLSEVFDKLYTHSYFSKEMYYRILIPRCFSNQKKVIYLDCDMVVLGNLKDLFNIDLGDCMIGACRNLMHAKMRNYVKATLNLDPVKYFNSGMIVFNIEKCHELEKKVWSIINKYKKLNYPDQDLLNVVCEDHVYYFDPAWNWLFHLERLQLSKNASLHLNEEDWELFQQKKNEVGILHYTGDQKPWDYNALPMARAFWKEAEKSNFYKEILSINLLKNKPKIVFQFVDFDDNKIVLTCCLILPIGIDDNCKIVINGNICDPAYSHITQDVYNHNSCVKKYFNIVVDYKSMLVKNSIYCVFDSKPLLFEYGKFFPLNGIPSSYFKCGHLIMYRENRVLIIKKYSFFERLKYEIKYDIDLYKSSKLAKKSLLARCGYLLLKPFIRKRIVLINDRPYAAGDNGEAMFRYLADIKPHGVKPYFVISKHSKDYSRLKRIGSVVSTGSIKLKILNLFAIAKLSSQTDYEVFTILDGRYLKDILYKTRNVFLQHGITKDDISKSYSRYNQNFRLFITAAHPEYNSIINNKAYACPKSITKLTGFARHDLLNNNGDRIILIAPTWRKSLLKDVGSGTLVDNFSSSSFYVHYKELLSDLSFKSFLKANGYKVYFVLHNMLRNANSLFEPYFDDVIINASSISYADLFSKSSIMVTDYSSNAFEFAYLKKFIAYFQFDEKEFFETHTYKKGYFDYGQDGFGPVVSTTKDLKNILKAAIKTDCRVDKEYLKRMDGFFAYNDKNNCKRIWYEVNKIL